MCIHLYIYVYTHTHTHRCIYVRISLVGDAEAAQQRCRADALALLGLLYRKSPAPLHNVTRALHYYAAALALLPSHCVAAAYLAELHVDAGDLERASTATTTLATLAQAQGTAACRQAQEVLHSRWSLKGWCARGPLAGGHVALSGNDDVTDEDDSGWLALYQRETLRCLDSTLP